MITEAISMCNELDLLEAHLEESQHWADRIVIIESPVTFTSIPKPMYFDENRERFKRFNVEHLVTPPEIFEKIPYSYTKEEERQWFKARRNNRNLNRQFHWDELRKDTDYVYLNDVDEFISRDGWKHLNALLKPNYYHYIAITLQRYDYFVNAKCSVQEQYRITRTDKTIFNMVRGTPRTATPNIGWHFTNCMNAVNIQRKIYGICCHIGMSPEEVPSVEEIQKRLDAGIEPATGVNLYAEVLEFLSKEDLSWAPKFMQDNIEMFPWREL